MYSSFVLVSRRQFLEIDTFVTFTDLFRLVAFAIYGEDFTPLSC